MSERKPSAGKASGATREPRPAVDRPPRQRVTLKDLAAHLDLSATTVSLVLNQSPLASSIPEATQRRVFEAAERFRYRPNHAAKSLRSRRSQTVGVLVPEIDEPYAAGVMSGIEDYLVGSGYLYLVASHQARQDLLQEYLEMFESRLVEGLILLATRLTRPPGVPTVVVSGHETLEGVTNVVLEHDRAARLALEHLAGLGHRRIAFFKGQAGSADTDVRWRGIERAAAELGLEIHDELVLQLVDDPAGELSRTEEGYQDGYRFGLRLVREERDFTALFAFNDVSAIGATRAFFEAGLRVPEDVSVIGFDDIASAAFHHRGLTTVRQPLRLMGERAGRILLERIASDARAPAVVTVQPELVVRESTGPAPRRPAPRRPAPRESR